MVIGSITLLSPEWEEFVAHVYLHLSRRCAHKLYTRTKHRWHLCAGIKFVHTQNEIPIRLHAVKAFGAIWLDCNPVRPAFLMLL